MKQFIIENKNKLIASALLVLLVGLGGYNLYQKDKQIQQVKQELLNEKNKQSNADVISTTILDKKSNIVTTEASIQELESKKRKLELEVTCWKNQMNRLVDGLEYNLEYCNDENNLTNFKEDFQ